MCYAHSSGFPGQGTSNERGVVDNSDFLSFRSLLSSAPSDIGLWPTSITEYVVPHWLSNDLDIDDLE